MTQPYLYGLFEAITNVLPEPEQVRTIFVVGCGPATEHHEIDWMLTHYNLATVYGFEPTPPHFNALSNKYAGHKRVMLFDMAVSSKDEVARFYVHTPPGAESLLPWNEQSKYLPKGHATHEAIDIVTATLDGFCSFNNIDHIDLLFMDAQGAENSVIRGAFGMLDSLRIGTIVGEAIFTDIYGTGSTSRFNDVYNALAVNGKYELFGLYRPIYADDGRLMYCDYVFIPKES